MLIKDSQRLLSVGLSGEVGSLWVMNAQGLHRPTEQDIFRFRTIFNRNIPIGTKDDLKARTKAAIEKAPPSAFNRREFFAGAGRVAVALGLVMLLPKVFRDDAHAQFFGGGGGGADTNSTFYPWHGDSANGAAVADSQTCTAGNGANRVPSDSVDGLCRMVIPAAFTMTVAGFSFYRTGSAPSSETLDHFVRKNDTTNSSAVTFAWSGAAPVQSTTSLSMAFSSGNDFLIRIVSQAMTSSPAEASSGFRLSGAIYGTI